jgi:hypothetical protein
MRHGKVRVIGMPHTGTHTLATGSPKAWTQAFEENSLSNENSRPLESAGRPMGAFNWNAARENLGTCGIRSRR